MKVDTKFLKASYAGLSPKARGILTIALIAGAGFIVYKLVKKGKQVAGDAGRRQEDRGWNKEYEKLNNNPATRSTMTEAQMQSIANSVHTAMDGYGTDEDGIVDLMAKIQNDADFAGVSASYGIREVSSGAYNPSPNYKGNMAGAIRDELSMYWIDLINAKFKRKGMKSSI